MGLTELLMSRMGLMGLTYFSHTSLKNRACLHMGLVGVRMGLKNNNRYFNGAVARGLSASRNCI